MRGRLRRAIKKEEKENHLLSHHTPLTIPTDNEMRIFEKHIGKLMENKRNPKILILGPSPELREITAERNLHTTVVADDLHVIERTARLAGKKNERESWLEGKLSQLPLKKNGYDAVLSDYVVSNLHHRKQENLFRQVKRILKNDGIIAIRSVVFTKTEKNFEKLLSKHFRILQKDFGKKGLFSKHFPIYLMRLK